MSKSKQLREERAKIVADAQAILRKPGITVEDRGQFDKLMNKADQLKAEIDRIEGEAIMETELRAGGRITGFDRLDARYESSADREYRMDFNQFLRTGRVTQRMAEKRDGQAAGTQTITYSPGTTGGFFVPAGFVYDVDVATKYYAPLMDGSVCRILETATGAVLPYPTSNDTSSKASIVTENNGPIAEADVTMGNVTFGAFKYSSGVIRVSLELLQDSAFDFEAFLKQQFAIRFGRAYEDDFTNGNGTTQPQGILTAIAASGASAVTAVGSSANDGSANTGVDSIGTQDLVELEHSIDLTYRRGAKWMLNDDTVRQVKNLLDKYGRPIWLPGLAVNAPDTILGYPYVVNQSFPKIAASATTVAFGQWEKFVIRKVRELSVLRLNERYADYGQIGFIGFSRADSKLVDAGTHPLNVLQQAS